ncbi:MAG: hypothetical protein U0103_08815 [Candidatus Obscuribacterales bacterium]
MLKKLLIACSITTALAAPANAQIFESFDSNSFLGSGLVGVNSQGVTLNTGGGSVDVNASFGPGGINGNFGGDGYGGSFNNNGVSVGTDSGFGGTFGSNGGTFSGPGGVSGTFNTGGGGTFNGPGGINGSWNDTGVQVGAGGTYANGSTSGGFGGGTLGSSGDTGEQTHSNGKTRGYQTVESPTFGHTTRNNSASIVGRDLQLPPIQAGNHWLAPVFGY